MSEPIHDELMRLSLKRELSADDRARLQACFAAHPELKAAWEENALLGRLVNALPPAAVSSNFTARVLQAIDLEERQPAPRLPALSGWRRWLRQFQPRMAWAVALVVTTGLGIHQYGRQQRDRMAHDVQHISRELASLPGPEVFRDFEAIDNLRQVAVSDDDLLRVLQQQ